MGACCRCWTPVCAQVRGRHELILLCSRVDAPQWPKSACHALVMSSSAAAAASAIMASTVVSIEQTLLWQMECVQGPTIFGHAWLRSGLLGRLPHCHSAHRRHFVPTRPLLVQADPLWHPHRASVSRRVALRWQIRHGGIAAARSNQDCVAGAGAGPGHHRCICCSCPRQDRRLTLMLARWQL